ncbi:hypothetical protein ACT29H_12735 [Thermophagus sp. OGC60D27]|uniref:hypothetical protein n=1 Tax=Thermophagus sp. OGC60D27 TaxID=3458415 RepID=UPI0040379971
MPPKTTPEYTIKLGFEEIKLPLFEDILIIGRKTPYGRLGLSKLFELLVPNQFDYIEVDDNNVEAIFINRKILNKINVELAITLLRKNIFPYVSPKEIVKVDFKIKIQFNSFDINA